MMSPTPDPQARLSPGDPVDSSLMDKAAVPVDSAVFATSRFPSHSAQDKAWLPRFITAHMALWISLAGLAAVFAFLWGIPLYSDEVAHFHQIGDFVRGHFHIRANITTLPGYHALVATGMWLTGTSDATSARLVSSCLILAAVVSWYAFLLRFDAKAASRTFCYLCFLPIALPYDFLLYTDILSLGLLLAALWATVASHPWRAALLITAAVCVRQTNIIWGLFFAYYHAQAQGQLWPPRRETYRALFLHLLPFALPMLLFAIFLLYNGGVAVGDRRQHELGVYPGNVFFCLALVALLFLPSLPGLWRASAQRSWRLAICLGLGVVAALSLAHLNHPYNYVARFLRNDALAWLHATMWHKAFYGVVVGLGAWIIWQTPMTHKWALVLVGCLYLLAHPLIEQRYAIPVFALFIVFRRRESDVWESLTLAWFIGVAILFLSTIRLWNYSL